MLEIMLILATILVCLLMAITAVEIYTAVSNHVYQNKVWGRKRPFFRWNRKDR